MASNVIAIGEPARDRAEVAAYDRMCEAIAAAVAVDDVKEIADKSAAFQEYSRRAGNFDAERQAAKIRIRAMRRMGELLKEFDRRPGARNDLATSDPADPRLTSPQPGARLTSYKQVLSDNGLPTTNAERCQKLADVPDADFTEYLDGAKIPTLSGALRACEPEKTETTESPQDVRNMPLSEEDQDFLTDGVVRALSTLRRRVQDMPEATDDPEHWVQFKKCLKRGATDRDPNVLSNMVAVRDWLSGMIGELENGK